MSCNRLNARAVVRNFSTTSGSSPTKDTVWVQESAQKLLPSLCVQTLGPAYGVISRGDGLSKISLFGILRILACRLKRLLQHLVVVGHPLCPGVVELRLLRFVAEVPYCVIGPYFIAKGSFNLVSDIKQGLPAIGQIGDNDAEVNGGLARLCLLGRHAECARLRGRAAF